ncbi:poly(A)-specific ribonuclease [Trifolium repens]|nr:poly(A)-specific ribonuclease [Trifolium repens]
MLKALSALPPSISSVTSVARKMSTSPTPPIHPKFISVEAADIHSRTKSDGFRFSFVSYNILAQVYVKSAFFPHSPPLSLKWKHRSNSILEVLKNLGADFFCLQELDEFDSFYKVKMQELGYSSIYMKRSGDKKRDGCGLFYKHDRAELVLEEKIEYNDLVKSVQDGNSSNDDEHGNVQTSQPDKQKDDMTKSGPKSGTEDRGDPNDPRVRLKRDCVGILAAFKFKGPSHQFLIVTNTHIYWDPEWADVKLAQAKYLLSRLAQFKTLVSDKYECTPEVIVAGDFNSQPGDMVYQYLISGNPSSELTTDYVEERPIPLSSVYASTKGEPPFTNYTPGFTGTLDYILFLPSDYIKPISYLELPDSEAADIVGGLPNFSHPSDHLPIGAEFEINKD